MSSFLDKAKALGGKAVEATADAVEIGTIKAKIAARKGDIDKQYEVMGQILYEHRGILDPAPEEDMESLREKLSAMKGVMASSLSEIARLEEEIAEL